MATARVLTCPRCPGVELGVVSHDRHEIDLCSSCKGLWLDASEWSAVIGPAASPSALSSRDVPAAASVSCPACLVTTSLAPCMEARTLVGAEGIVIDACPSCQGAWLDGGELARLRQQLAAARARPAPPAAFGTAPTPAAPPPPLPRSGAGGPPPSQGFGAGAVTSPTMGEALLSTSGEALMLLLQLASATPRSRGIFGRPRRRSGVRIGTSGLVSLLFRLLRR